MRVVLDLRDKDVTTAKRVASRLGVPYDNVLRGWIAERAAFARNTPGGSGSLPPGLP